MDVPVYKTVIILCIVICECLFFVYLFSYFFHNTLCLFLFAYFPNWQAIIIMIDVLWRQISSVLERFVSIIFLMASQSRFTIFLQLLSKQNQTSATI